jgi:mannose-1-phosphate guanylyltransferase
MRRNTAAAVAVATLHTPRTSGDDLVLVVPSDHEILTDIQLWQTVEAGATVAEAGHFALRGRACPLNVSESNQSLRIPVETRRCRGSSCR